MDAIDRKKPARQRRLAPHDLELWEHVTRHVTPLPGKAIPRPAVSSRAPAVPGGARVSPGGPSQKVMAATVKPLAPLEQGLLRDLSRGRLDPDSKIDLHGMRQAEAHARLRSFLHHAHAGGLRLTLVVTGKGSAAAAPLYEERGVLRRMLPHWLSAPDLRHIVLGFREASRRHGGEGAFYVRLRGSNSARLRNPS